MEPLFRELCHYAVYVNDKEVDFHDEFREALNSFVYWDQISDLLDYPILVFSVVLIVQGKATYSWSFPVNSGIDLEVFEIHSIDSDSDPVSIIRNYMRGIGNG